MREAAKRALEKRLVILIVNEQQFLIDLFAEQLGNSQVHVVGATSAEKAKERLWADKPDVLILDADMPDAFDLLQAVRSATAASAVLAITKSHEVRHRLDALGVEMILGNGVHFNALLRSLQNYVNGTLDLPLEQETRILVVDDQNEVRESISGYLANRGHTVLTASTGREALELLEREPPIDLVILDIRISDIGGLEVLAAVKTWRHRPQMIVMTAIDDATIAQHARELGAFDYLVKPIETETLENAIVAGLAHAEYQRQSWWKRLVG